MTIDLMPYIQGLLPRPQTHNPLSDKVAELEAQLAAARSELAFMRTDAREAEALYVEIIDGLGGRLKEQDGLS